MTPQNEEARPRARGAGSRDENADGGHVGTRVSRWCPCGCLTKPPYFDDPECVRHRPFTYDLTLYERAEVSA